MPNMYNASLSAIERWAIAFLEARGFVVLPDTFRGIAIGRGRLTQVSQHVFACDIASEKIECVALNDSILNLWSKPDEDR